MKKLAILSAIFLGITCQAQECAVIGCKILLEKDEFTSRNGHIYINQDTVESIFRSFEAWQMLDFHVFIYVECQYCGQAHPIDYTCANPNCRGHNKIGSMK